MGRSLNMGAKRCLVDWNTPGAVVSLVQFTDDSADAREAHPNLNSRNKGGKNFLYFVLNTSSRGLRKK